MRLTHVCSTINPLWETSMGSRLQLEPSDYSSLYDNTPLSLAFKCKVATFNYMWLLSKLYGFKVNFLDFYASGECCNVDRAYSYTVSEGCSNQPAKSSLFVTLVCLFLLTHFAKDEHLPCCTWNKHFTAASFLEYIQYCHRQNACEALNPHQSYN